VAPSFANGGNLFVLPIFILNHLIKRASRQKIGRRKYTLFADLKAAFDRDREREMYFGNY